MTSLPLTKSRRSSDAKSGGQRLRRIPSAERRVQLLEAAREIIRRDGAGALTMSALADAVGVSKPIVYKHFANSEAVIIRILEAYVEGSVEKVRERVRQVDTIYEFIDKVIESLFEYIKSDGTIIRSITNGFSSSSDVDAYFLEMKNRSTRVYCYLLQQQGVPHRRASVAAYALMEMIDSTILEFAPTSTGDDEVTLKEMVRGALRVLMNGGGEIKPRVPVHILETPESG